MGKQARGGLTKFSINQRSSNTSNDGNNKYPVRRDGVKKSNPFDLKVNKTKFEILNRGQRGTRGAPQKAKQRAMEIRQKTLLPELGQRYKASNFVDRRFGERDASIDQDAKMLERFTRERQRLASKCKVVGGVSKKRSIFNLGADEGFDDDGDINDALLYHKGQSIDELSSFEQPQQDCDEDGTIDRYTVAKSHFGGFQDSNPPTSDESRKKTKGEVMQEVIAKSKFYKQERQKLKEQNEELCDELDADFESIRNDLMWTEKGSSRKSNVQSVEKTLQSSGVKSFDYDEAIRAMAFDRRAIPSDRTKTTEELMAEAKEKRTEAEAQAQKRMIGDDVGEEAISNSKEEEKGPKVAASDYARVAKLVTSFCKAKSQHDAQVAYGLVVLAAKSAKDGIVLTKLIRNRLYLMAKEMKTKLNGTKPLRVASPSVCRLLLFHLIGKIYSTSDFHHILATPAQLLLAGYLEWTRIRTPNQVMSILFIVQTLLKFQAESKRFFPEILVVLNHLLQCFVPRSSEEQATKIDGEAINTQGCNNEIWENDGMTKSNVKEGLVGSFLNVELGDSIGFDELVGKYEFDSKFRTIVLGHLTIIIKEAGQLYSGLPAFPELFAPALSLLKVLGQTSSIVSVECLRDRVERTNTLLSILISSALSRRTPLRLQHHKPIPLPQLTPHLDYMTEKDPEQADQQRLKAAYRRERKGAKRELRRDNAFLSVHQANERERKDSQYKEMINRIMGTIANDAYDAGNPSGRGEKRKRRS